MNKWQPMETVPADTHVELGHWDLFANKREWRTNQGIAKESRRWLFWSWTETTYRGEENTHWRPLPPAPVTDEATE